MTELETLYLKLPIPLQHAICSLEGWRIQRSRFGGAFPALLGEARSRTYWPVQQVRAYRDQRVRAFVQHCALCRRRFQECGISPDDIQTLEDLQRLPILTKEEVQDHCPEVVSEAVPKHQQIMTHTSGTTGGGLGFGTTLRAMIC